MATISFASSHSGRQRAGLATPDLGLGALLPGASLAGAPGGYQEEQIRYGREWPPAPAWWWHSEEEWIVYWYLKNKLKYVEGQDFYYQGRVYVPYLYQGKDFTQADFIIDLGPESPAGTLGDLTALVFDPFTEFTHDHDLDYRRWQALEDEGYGLIFMAEHDIKWRLAFTIAEGLKGKDLSNRGWGAV